MTKRAIIHVENTEGILEFADYLSSSGWTILSANKTEELLKKQKIPVIREQALVENSMYVTDTSNLVRRILQTKYDDETYLNNVENEEDNDNISIVCMNITPYMNTSIKMTAFENGIVPSSFNISNVIRSAYANYENILLLTDPADYKEAIIQLKTGDISKHFRIYLAAKALNLISAFDSGIAASILQSAQYNENFLNYLVYPFKKELSLQCGANAQQLGFLYRSPTDYGTANSFLKIPGKELPYNLISDICYAWGQINTLFSILKNQLTVKSTNNEGYAFTTQFTPFTGNVFTIAVKFNSIVGASLASNVLDSFKQTYTYEKEYTDNVVLACSAVIDAAAAEELVKCNFAAIVAPGFTAEVKQIFADNKTTRLIPSGKVTNIGMDGKLVNGGIILQTRDSALFNQWKVKTKNRPSQILTDQMAFGMLLVMGARSYSAVLLKNNTIIGIAQGCTSSARAIEGVDYEARFHNRRNNIDDNYSAENSLADVLACDAEIPFTPMTKDILDSGVKAVIQTGGTPSDEEFINYCDEHGIVMIFTGMTHISF